MTPNVPMSESGTATLGMAVAQTLRRNAKTTSTTSEIEIRSVISTSRMEARMVVVRSLATPRCKEGEMSVWSCGRSARMRSTVSIMFAPGWRKMASRTAGSPLDMPALRTSSTESMTLPIASSRTGAPLRQATIRGRYSCALKSWSVAPMLHAWPGFATSPLGRFAFAEASAARTVSMLMP